RTAEILQSVLQQDIDWSVLPTATPPRVRRLLGRCLERDAKQRLRDIGEARIALGDPYAVEDTNSAFAGSPESTPRWNPRAWVTALGALVVTAVIAWFLAARPSTPVSVTRFTNTLPQGRALTLPTSRHIVALSPDGSHLVYAANDRLYLQSMAELDAFPI